MLDCASGEGYGSALLSQVARSVVGIEIDEAAVEAARTEFAYPNLNFRQGDARALPLPDASVDVAISFETLEHLFEQDRFLSELRRVLRPDGLLIISTPDRDIYSPLGTAPNPFHCRELTRVEFETLLHQHFANTVVAGQRAMIGSVILGSAQEAPARSFERRGESHIEASDDLARAMYLLALASNAPLPPLRNSVYIYRSDLDTDTQVRFDAEIGRRVAEQALEAATAATADLEQRLREADERAIESQAIGAHAADVITDLQREQALLRTQYARLEHHLAEAEAEAARLGQQGETLRQRGEALEHHLANAVLRAEQLGADAANHTEVRAVADHLRQRLAEIEGSSIWRSSYPIRQFGSRFPVAARGGRVGAKLVWWTATLQLRQRYRLWRDYRALRHLSLPGQAPGIALLEADMASGASPASPPAPSSIGGIQLPYSREPLVSVIISTYGQLDVTLACLRSLTVHPPSVQIEVIVVDDAYPGPEDMAVLRDIPGIQLLRNAANLGFLLSCNRAARTAKGRYIYMLNNDTELQPGSIDTLAAVLESRADIGMVGSKLLFPDGRLQEAGGILWSDATGWNYGRGENPSRPDFNYLREVDYCSGASVMIRRDLFETLGGFDEEFAPAYYEDTDLAFRIRASGQKVVYEPHSVVIHHEGASHGTDVTAGVKAHQLINRDRMLARWARR